MYTVGITGGIGCGKSVVAHLFRILEIPVYDADQEAKKLYDNDPMLKALIIENFGPEVYPNHRFHPKVLGEIVFRDPQKLQLLNEIIHPRVIAHSLQWMKQQTSSYVIKEAALLIESGSYQALDALIVVSSPIEMRIARVMQRDHISRDAVEARINQQMPETEKAKFAQHIIENNECKLLIPQVLALHNLFLSQTISTL
jgi:dephospho-CoA kinase